MNGLTSIEELENELFDNKIDSFEISDEDLIVGLEKLNEELHLVDKLENKIISNEKIIEITTDENLKDILSEENYKITKTLNEYEISNESIILNSILLLSIFIVLFSDVIGQKINAIQVKKIYEKYKSQIDKIIDKYYKQYSEIYDMFKKDYESEMEKSYKKNKLEDYTGFKSVMNSVYLIEKLKKEEFMKSMIKWLKKAKKDLKKGKDFKIFFNILTIDFINNKTLYGIWLDSRGGDRSKFESAIYSTLDDFSKSMSKKIPKDVEFMDVLTGETIDKKHSGMQATYALIIEYSTDMFEDFAKKNEEGIKETLAEKK